METTTETLPLSKTRLKSSSASHRAFDLLTKCREHGFESSPRGQSVMELFMENIEIDPTFPCPHFESRPFNWQYFAGELGWYLTGVKGIDYINNFSSFWKGLVDENNSINSNYGNLLFYSNQLIWAYSVLAADKDSRQAISFVSRPEFQYEGNKDFVCTLYLNFWIRNNTLHMKVQMRSNDIFYGLTYDAPFFASVMQTMWYNLKRVYPDLELGVYHHCADNIHYYQKHFELAERIMSEPIPNPTFLFLREPLFWIESDCLVLTQNTLEFQEQMATLIQTKGLTQESCKAALEGLFFLQ